MNENPQLKLITSLVDLGVFLRRKDYRKAQKELDIATAIVLDEWPTKPDEAEISGRSTGRKPKLIAGYGGGCTRGVVPLAA